MANSLNNFQLIDNDNDLIDSQQLNLSNKQSIAVHKFGGSSLATAQRLENVVKIIKNQTNTNDYIVVSANGDMTDWLLEFSNGELEAIEKIKNYYLQLVSDCLIDSFLIDPFSILNLFYRDIEKLETSCLSQNEIVAFGEVWSARILVGLLTKKNIPSLFVDAREILSTNSIDSFKHFNQDYFIKGIEKLLYGNFGKRLIITGFIATNSKLETITLGRNGSDYTASLLANLVQAKSVTLWTDVKGIFSADPNLIKAAKPIDFLSFYEAQALASVGTNVLHQKTIAPLQDKQIPLFIRSSLEPEYIGTCVSNGDHSKNPIEKIINPSENNKITKNLTIEKTSNIKIKSIAIKHNLLSVKLCLKNKIKNLLIEELNNIGIYHIETGDSINQQDLTLLIEQTQIQTAICLFDNFNINYAIGSEKHTLIALVGSEIIYQKIFLQILQKILSIQFKYKTIFSHSDDLFLISTTESNPTEFLELIYLCCNSEHFFNDVKQSIGNDYTLFDKKITSQNSENCSIEKTIEVN